MSIEHYTDATIHNKLLEFDELGGCLEFRLFTIEEAVNPYAVHRKVARETLVDISKANEDYYQKLSRQNSTGRNQFNQMTIDFDQLENSGTQISLRDFLGPHFDLKNNKPLIKGIQRFKNSYFYYDSEETDVNIIRLEEVSGQFNFSDSDGVTGAFCGAFWSRLIR